jgi:hypothetical protein
MTSSPIADNTSKITHAIAVAPVNPQGPRTPDNKLVDPAVLFRE